MSKKYQLGPSGQAKIKISRTALLIIAGFTTPSMAAYDTTCTAGSYLDGFIACRKCPAGYFCTTGANQPEPCPDGQYSVYGSSSCTVCPAGFYCPSIADSLPTGEAAAGLQIPCPTGMYSFKGSRTCTTCPDGFTCNESGILAACEPGYMCDWSVIGTSYTTRPRACYAGKYCYLGVETACPDGTYSAAASSQCTVVPAGSYLPGNNKAHPPQPCPDGYYSDQVGTTSSCTPCPIGYYCPTANKALSPTLCPLGTYAPITGMTSCNPCPAGFYCSDATQYPTNCPVGTYSTGSGTNGQGLSIGFFACAVCPAGSSCLGGQTPATCSSGYYSYAGDGVCSICPAGYRCPDPTVQPILCEPGQYNLPGKTTCTTCPEGHFCVDPTSTPSICPQGQWAPAGSSMCSNCPLGFKCDNSIMWSPGTASTSRTACTGTTTITSEFHEACYACPAGYACPQSLTLSIVPCGPGFYSTTSMNYCQVANAGTFVYDTRLAPTTVSSGYFAEIGASSQTLVFPGKALKTIDGRHTILCKPGWYSTALGVCVQAAAGTYMPIAYAASGHRSGGIDCPDGMWSLAGAIECRICQPGYDCTNKAAIPSTQCAYGTYQIGGQMGCTQCPVGHECNDGQTLAPCPVWHYANAGSDDCAPCPEGYDCSKTTLANYNMVACPAGTYGTAQSLGCITCPQGYFCQGVVANPTTPGPQICPGGTYSGGGASSCTTCPSDYYAEKGNQFCTPVPPGFKKNSNTPSDGITVCPQKTYSDWGDSTCSTCPNGYLCPEKTQFYTAELSCPRGSYCIAGVQYKCPQGYFGIKERGISQSDACSQCPSGYNCIEGTEHFQLAPCPMGAYCPNGIYTACPAGTTGQYLYGVSLNDCITSPAGTSSTAGSTASTTCGQGYYCPSGAAFPGYPCPAGTFGGYMSGKIDPSQCLPCPPGYYCPVGSAAPTPVPVGYFNPLQGIDSMDGVQLCPPKFYCPDTGMTNYLGYHCSPGYYCPAGSSSPTANPCPAGTYSDRVDIHDVRTCLACPRGYTCASGTTSTNGLMVVCPVGSFCDLGSAPGTTAILCPAGTYSPTIKSMSMQDCLPCKPGYYCLQTSTNPVNICPAGYYCPLGTQYGTQYPCLQGTYSSTTGLMDPTQCMSCGVNKYCPSLGLTAPLSCADGYYNDYTVQALYCDLCPAGYYCVSGQDHPQPCSEGYYSDRGATTCSRCSLGHYCAIKGTTYVAMLAQKCPAGTFCSATVDSLIGGLATYPNKKAQTDSGNACAPYFYCPEGTPYQIAITPNSYETILIQGAGYLDEGIMTPAGYQDQQLTVCPTGQYCPAGTRSSTQAYNCPKGTYRSNTMGQDVSDCGVCPAGYYCPNVGTSTPIICPTGKFCPEGTILGQDCPLGTYNDLTGLMSSRECKSCPAGFYCPTLGMSTYTLTCDAGFVCYGGSFRPEPTDKTTGDICPAGYYCTSAGLQLCGQGTQGIYQGASDISACMPCEKGNYCKGGANPAIACPAGYFCPEGSYQYQVAEQTPVAGYYNVIGQEQQMACPIGSYTRVGGQSSCTYCEQGYWCHTIALSTPDTDAICPAGYYCPSYSSVTSGGAEYNKLACPAGTYQPGTAMTSLSDCLPCPAGKACEIVGNGNVAADLPDCAAGFYCTAGSPSRYPYSAPTTITSSANYGPCPVGYWCTAGTQTATANPCLAGTFSNQERAVSADYCLVCPPGFLCETDGLYQPNRPAPIGTRTEDGILANLSCDPSGANKICPLGTFIAQQCPTGYYQDTANQGKCIECDVGSSCINGSSQNCLPGYYCP